MASTLDAETIVARCIPILKYAAKPMDCVALARILGGTDSSSVFRALDGAKQIKTVRSKEATTFEWSADAQVS